MIDQRMWATFGNILRISAVFSFIGAGLAMLATLDLLGAQRGGTFVLLGGAVSAVMLLLAFLYWMAKPALVSGRPFWVRWLVGLYMAWWVFSTLGLALIFIGIVYLFTGEPERERSFWRTEPPVVPRYKRPINWQPSGHVGPSGAMVYSDPQRTDALGIFDSGVPVQLTDERDGYARVIAATGLAGWIDSRTLIKTAGLTPDWSLSSD